MRGVGGLMAGGEEIWTIDKERRGRAGSKERYMDTTTGWEQEQNRN